MAIADGGGLNYYYNLNERVCYTGEGLMFRTPERLEPVPAETGAAFVLHLPDPTGDAPCLAAAV